MRMRYPTNNEIALSIVAAIAALFVASFFFPGARAVLQKFAEFMW